MSPRANTVSAVLLEDHAAALERFIARAAAVPPEQWHVPRAEGKWSAAQQTKHLALTFEALARELRGGPGVKLIGRWWQRRIWRWFGFSQVLVQGRIPGAVRAPREVRPPDRPGEQADLLSELRSRAEEFESALAEALRERPRMRATHPYFGSLSLSEAVRFCAVHTRHHTGFLPE